MLDQVETVVDPEELNHLGGNFDLHNLPRGAHTEDFQGSFWSPTLKPSVFRSEI